MTLSLTTLISFAFSILLLLSSVIFSSLSSVTLSTTDSFSLSTPSIPSTAVRRETPDGPGVTSTSGTLGDPPDETWLSSASILFMGLVTSGISTSAETGGATMGRKNSASTRGAALARIGPSPQTRPPRRDRHARARWLASPHSLHFPLCWQSAFLWPIVLQIWQNRAIPQYHTRVG